MFQRRMFLICLTPHREADSIKKATGKSSLLVPKAVFAVLFDLLHFRLSFMQNQFARNRWVLILSVLLGAEFLFPSPAAARTPEDPEVRRLVQNALKFLENSRDDRLGGTCLIALCFKKADVDDHPRITQAIEACYKADIKNTNFVDNYSLGIALMLLCEIDAQKHHDLIVAYLEETLSRQKGHGGWGYPASRTGDTSQSQYAILGMWMAKNIAKIDVPVDRMEGACGWLMRTQDPSGAWGYQGNDPGSLNRVAQTQVTTSLAAAGAGQLYMIADLLQVTQNADAPAVTKSKAMQDIEVPGTKKAIRGPLTKTLNPADIKNSLAMGDRNLGLGFKLPEGLGGEEWNHYYMYALERYHAFREKAGGVKDTKWYDQGYDYLAKSQNANGSWPGRDTPTVATCFATLFLLRSAKKAIDKKLGEGLAKGGQGLPPDVKSIRATEDGQVLQTGVVLNTEEIFQLIKEGKSEQVTQLAEEKEALKLSDNATDRSRQIETLRKWVSAGSFETRMVAVTTLSKVRDLNLVPQLLYALTDPDPAIVKQADKGLRFISRKVDGVGLPDGELTTAQIKSAQAGWKAWYLSIRPNAELLD